MLQHAVALLLQRLLGRFVTFDSSMLKLSLWQGDLSFQDLQLRLSYGDGEIGHLSVKIPWRALWTQPVQIKAQGIRISLHQTPEPQHEVETTELENVDTSIDGSNGDDRTYLSRLVSHIIANVQIELSDVQVRYDCDPSSLAPQPGSGTLEIGHVSLINTNAEWELEFTPQSSSAMESRKLLKTEGVAAYIEYPDMRRYTDDDLASPKMHRKYLFHEWRSTVKTSLYYHSVNAAFPDVELDVDIGCDPGSMREQCEICAAHNASGDERFVLQSKQPRVHFGPEHIDVLYAILIEVKAPYDEYDRLAALTQQQVSRPDGFLMVLSYAKQWLLTDCLDAVVGETFTLAADDDYDDDDDEFEDAITPPSLSVRAELRHGAGIFFSARDSVATEEEIVRGTQWVWIIGDTVGVIKQSCVEDEVQLCVESLRMYEVAERSESYRIIDHASRISGNVDSGELVTTVVRISCVVPAYQSRLVGHQPALDVQLGSMMMFIKDETLVMWMTLFAPVYLWWNQWNLSHPSKLVTYDEAQIAPIAHLGIKMEKVCCVFALHDHFCFGVELKDLVIETSEPDREFVQSDFRTSLRLFSMDKSLALLQTQMALSDVQGLHEILAVSDFSLTKKSHSRTQWSMDSYSCRHCTLGRHGVISYEQHEADLEQETAMYNYEARLSTIKVDWKVTELEALCWVIGKWSFFFPEKPVNGPDRDLHPAKKSSSVNLVCQRKLSVRTPEVRLCVSDDRPNQSSMFVLSIKDVDWSSRVCTTTVTESVSISSISLEEGENVIIQAAGSPGLRAPALSVTYLISRTYSTCSEPDIPTASSILRFNRQATRAVISVERLHGYLFLPDVRTILTWIGGCHDRYLLGFILSTSLGYEPDDFRRNLSKLGTQTSSTLLEDSSCFNDEVVMSLSVLHGLQMDIKHRDQTPGALVEGAESIKAIARVEMSSMSLQATGSGAAVCGGGFEVKGSVRNLQLTDLTSPSGSCAADVVLPNRQAIGSPSEMLDGVADVGAVGVKNVVDFVINSSKDGGILARVRLDSVCIVYLHRVFKQFYHYVFDHVADAVVNSLDEFPKREKAEFVYKSFMVNTAALPVSVEDLLCMYFNAVVTEVNERAGAMGIAKGEMGNVRFEVVGNDLAFALPRSSFSRDSIILRSTNARFWSSGIDPSTSDFLQNGTFVDESRLSYGSALAGASAAKAQLSRRTELRNLRRQIKNQRSRILSNRSQLFIDLRSATQQAQNYLHEGFQALPAAEDAVKIIHSKILHLDQQLEQLTQHLLKVDEALDEAKAEGEALNSGGRDSLQFLSSTPTSGTRRRSDSMEQIRHEVASMSQHLMTPLFVSEDAEFHDARVTSSTSMVPRGNGDADMSTYSVGLFEFELVDLSSTTRDSASALFHHSLLTGRIDSEPESMSEAALSSFYGVSLSMNELSIGTGQEQYTTLLGMIYENFREVSRVVTEETYPLCATCGGLHYDTEFCRAIWMRIPVKIADAALRISNNDHPVADIFWEQLELVFTLRTDDSVEFNGSALSFTTADIRPTRCQTASEIVRPLPGDGLQIEYNQKMNWTDSVYDLKVRNTNFLGVYPAFHDIIAFFAEPVLAEGEFLNFGAGYMSPPPPDWQKIDFFVTTSGCLFSLLEDFETTDARALVMLTDVVAAYSTHRKCKGATDMTKCHLEFDQHGVYFSQLPDLQIDASFPLSNSFLLVFDHFVEGSITLSRRNSFVLAPVETRFSVQDANLFINIANNYLRWIPSSSRATSVKVAVGEMRNGSNKRSQSATPTYIADKLLGDVGELRLVLVNNSLGIPIADFHMREIVCEYIKDEDYSTTMGATLLFNYFNNSIYRWEPLVEPFVVQMRIHRALEENSLVEVFANLPNTVNFNMTPAMAPLLSSEALRQADFVTSGSKSTAPFWIENKTGLELKFSFRRGTGTVIQQIVPDSGKVSVDCREQGDMLTFDSASADRFLRETDRQALTVNHTLSVWLNGNKWVSTNPVVVDMVGHVAVPLRESLVPVADADANDFENGGEEDISPPTLVAEISIQADGSKLISLHSQVVLQNRTSVPLMVWAFSPCEGGCIQEWIIDREQVCHIPLQLVHPQSKISIRPSPYVQYAPLTTSLEELGDEVRAAKSVNSKRFVRAGNCTCNFETFDTMEELQSAAKSLEMVSSSSMSSAIPLSGYVVRDLPTWKCTYEVEAYYLMRATFSSTEEPLPVEESVVDLEKVEEEEGEQVEDDFLHVFGEPARRQRKMNPLRDMNYELDEARAAGQRRGLYEATNSSLYYLSVSPFLTLHNRLATAMAYRLLNGSLQLIAEGILAVGNVLPLFQVDTSELLYISFRLENYSWSAPKLIINPKMSVYSVPYKETIEPVQLLGRAFDRDITGEQGSVPNLQLQVKLSGRDVIVFCSIWVVNHSDLELEYCNSTSSSSKRLEGVLKYVHRRAGSSEEYRADFSARSMSFHGEGSRETQLTRLHKVKPSTNPVAVIVVIREARDLYNAQFFGSQSPYVRASLYVLKNPKDRYLEKPEMVAICSTTTKPSPSGGLSPQWLDARLQNTLLLRFPPEVRTLDLARIIIEVRNVRYGLDTCLGVTAVKVDSILKDRKRAAAFNWYKLLKRKSSREKKASKNNLASIHRGDISISFSVGTSQELPSDMDAEDTVEEVVEDSSSPSIHDEEMTVTYLERLESEDFEFDDMEHSATMDGQQTPGLLPSTSAARSMQRLQTPSSHDTGLLGAPTTMRARQAYTFTGDSESQELLSYDPTSTRAMGALITNGSPIKPAHAGRPHGIQVYLPHNRFACVVVEVYPSSLMSEVFDLVCMKCGFVGVLDIQDFDFYELALPRFVSLRSAGRPEGERWYGQPISMSSKIENRGRRHGLHLCHKITMTTIRLYDEASTASTHHVTPRSLVSSSKRSNPAQIRPMPWGDVLPYSSGGKHWDVLRLKSRSSPWSDVIRLNRNAMGNSGVAQVISLTNEVYDQDPESELRKGTQEVALWSCYGSGRFSETIMATVVPRYILINKTEETIKYRQFGAPQTFRLAANDLVPFHWPSASREKLLEVSLLHKYSWSGSFRINSLGTTYLKLRDRNDLSRIYILQCQIELVGGSVALIFREESKRFPPYRIDNMTSYRIRYKQTNWGEDKDFDELLPRSSCPYSWDYLNGSEGKSSSSSNQDPAFPGSSTSSSRSLQVRFMRVTSSASKAGGDSDKDAVEIREYNLDEMATHKRIQLHRSLPSELFLKPEQKGYLLKKDSMLKWNRKYFRLYEHMLYYFANETDQELLGVVDLRTGSDVPGVGGVAIFEKAAEAPSKSGFISLNGLVSSISGSFFGGGSRQKNGGDDDDDDDGDDRSRELVRLAVSLTTSSVLCEESEKFVNAHVESGAFAKSGVTRKGFYVNGQDLVDFLVTEMSTQTKSQAFTTAQEMLELGVLKPIQISSDVGAHKQAPLKSFQCSKHVWYSVDSINLAEDSDLDSEDSVSITTPRDSNLSSSKASAKPLVVGSNQFSIITPTKCYDLKAKNPKIAKIWVRRLRLATQGGQVDDFEEMPEETLMAGAPKTMRSQRDLVPQVQNAKTYVHVRIRADGPTKVLELFEGGEEDFDERENKFELSSTASASSDSPTASEISANALESLTSGMALHLRVDGVGISCVNELPMELVYVYLGGISLHYSRVNSNMRMNITLDDVQIDNQSEEATFTKLLCPRMENGAAAAANPTRKRTIGDIDEDLAEMVNQGRGVGGENGDDESLENTGLISNQNIFSCADCKYRQANVAAMHFCCTWSNEQGTTDYFKHCSFWLYPVITQLDEELLVSARAFMAAMSQSWGQNRSQNRGGEIRMKSIPIEMMMESLAEYRENTHSDELNPLTSLKSYTTTSSSETRKVYFALLHIHPMDFDITFRSDVFQTSTTISLHEAASFKKSGSHADEMKRSSSAPPSFGDSTGDDSSSVTWAIPSLTMHVPDLDNAPVRLNALMIEHAFGTSGDLTRRVSKYYTRQLWKQLHKILGSFDFLGNPVGFLDHIGTGVRDFVYEPLEGLKIGGKGFSKGLAKGTASLMTNTVDGTFDAASKISGTFGQGFANLSLDDHYQHNRARARRRHVRGLREGLVQGSRELSLGVYEGVAGLVLNPMRGAQESGAVGFVKGTITGIIGLPVKPVAGIFDFASRATQGVRNRSLQNGQNMQRVRRPRVFGRYNELKCYKEADTIAYELLKRVGGERLSGEKIIFYNEIMQSVSAADLTREARDRRRSGSNGGSKSKSNDSTRERTNSLRRALQEDDERRRAAGEPPNAGTGESSGRKLRYEAVFYQKKLGMDLETDFYCENVTIKAIDETSRSKVKVRGQIAPGQLVLQEGDCLIGVGGVDVRGIGFHETLALLRGTARPITAQFESAEELMQEAPTPKPDNSDGGEVEFGATSRARLRRLSLAGPGSGNDAVDESIKKLKVQLSHWLIVTEQRVLYINVGSYTKPVVEWTTPLRYIYRVEWQKNTAQICLHLSVGVDSLPMGPRLRPSLKAIDGHERDMNVFLDVMWHSFGSATAEEQELWPSDTSLNGYLLKKGGFSTVRRWFVLSRNCLYYFSSRKQLRGIIPLGHVRLETDAGDARCLRITNATRSQPLVTLQLDSGQVVERVQSEVVLVAASTQELEMWQSSLAHAAGRGMRHSRGTRFFVPTAASRLEIGTQETPDFVVKPLAEALKKTVEVFNTKLP
ncbi:PH domain-containing protein [Phytophthora infestans]|uniref:PH domain-containing protein n=1 Tax=Phytophthora infestans TaxID=4787 RepID=A0A8S9USY5_PHYIN|nr:PH domain-containing protein [Phytophthora infestans]